MIKGNADNLLSLHDHTPSPKNTKNIYFQQKTVSFVDDKNFSKKSRQNKRLSQLVGSPQTMAFGFDDTINLTSKKQNLPKQNRIKAKASNSPMPSIINKKVAAKMHKKLSPSMTPNDKNQVNQSYYKDSSALNSTNVSDAEPCQIHFHRSLYKSNKKETIENIWNHRFKYKNPKLVNRVFSPDFFNYQAKQELVGFDDQNSSNVNSLKLKIQKLESENQKLYNQAVFWKQKYMTLKEIVHNTFEIANTKSTNIEQELNTVKIEFSLAKSDNLEISTKLKECKTELENLKNTHLQYEDFHSKKEKILKFMLDKTMKSKLSDPIVKYLLSSLWKNPFGLTKYFKDDNHAVIKFLTYLLNTFKSKIDKRMSDD